MTEQIHVAFAARRLGKEAVGGIEQFSRDVLEGLQARFTVSDLACYGSAKLPVRYLWGLRRRLRATARAVPRLVVDLSDATLCYALRGLDAPSVVRIHGLDLLHRNRLYQRILKRSLPLASHYVANSDATQELLLARGVQETDTTVVHPAAHAPAQIAEHRDPKRLLMLGRLVPRKGFVEFIEQVWPMLAGEGYRLDVVGAGPEWRRLCKAREDAPAGKRISLHGQLPRSAVEAAFHEAGTFVMFNQPIPGDWEGFGIVAAESASFGVPVVAARMQGITDAVLEGDTGLLCTPQDAEEFAEAIRVCASEARLDDRRRVSRLAQERYGVDRLWREYANVIERMAGGAGL